MGWYGEVQESLRSAAQGIDGYPKNSLGWLLEVNEWNRWVNEGCEQWDDVGLFGDDLPKNCVYEWEESFRETGQKIPFIHVPDFDPNQILNLLGE